MGVKRQTVSNARGEIVSAVTASDLTELTGALSVVMISTGNALKLRKLEMTFLVNSAQSDRTGTCNYGFVLQYFVGLETSSQKPGLPRSDLEPCLVHKKGERTPFQMFLVFVCLVFSDPADLNQSIKVFACSLSTAGVKRGKVGVAVVASK